MPSFDALAADLRFGAVLFELATGRKAFSGGTPSSLIAAILPSEPPPPSSLQPLSPPAFDRIVATCLAKDREERWRSAIDVARQLRYLADGRGRRVAHDGCGERAFGARRDVSVTAAFPERRCNGDRG